MGSQERLELSSSKGFSHFKVKLVQTPVQWISRESDVLIKVSSPEEGEFLLLNEIQLRHSDKMPRRMRAYTALAEEKYGLPTYPVVINILPPSANATVISRYESNFKGLIARQDFRVINLSEVDVQVVFEQNVRTLLPFVPVLQGGASEVLIQQAAQLLRQDENLTELESLLGFFASFVLNTELVAQILRWDMVVLRESPWYQEILQEGERRGKEQGLEQGLERQRALVLRLLSRRFGSISEVLNAKVVNLSFDELESLVEAQFDFSGVTDLAQWLKDR